MYYGETQVATIYVPSVGISFNYMNLSSLHPFPQLNAFFSGPPSMKETFRVELDASFVEDLTCIVKANQLIKERHELARSYLK